MKMDLTKGKSADMLKDIASKSREENGKKTTKNIDIDLIDKSEDNDLIFNMDNRENLTSSIERNGFQGTVQVYLNKDGRYTLLSGHRRYESAKELGYKEIPCEIIEEPNEVMKAEILIMSNLASRNLTPVEKGRAIKYYEKNVLLKEDFKGNRRDELAKRFGITGSQVYKLMALSDLIRPLQDLVETEKVSYASVYNLANLSEDLQMKIYEDIIKKIHDNGGTIIGKEIDFIVKYHTNFEEEKEIENEERDRLEDVSPKDEEKIQNEVIVENNEVEEDIKYPANTSLFSQRKPIEKNEFISPRVKETATGISYDEQRILSNTRNLLDILIRKERDENGNPTGKFVYRIINSEETANKLKELKTLLIEMNI